ncbi:MAG: RDD family protein [Myxococcales bacterium]
MTSDAGQPPPRVAVIPGGGPAARSARREGSPYPKAGLLPRAVGRVADIVVSLALSSVAGPVGLAAGLLYLLIADAIFSGQSLGKRLAGIKVVYVPTREPANLSRSMIRNSPFALAFVFYAVPIVGWFLLVIVGLPLVAFESYMAYSDSLGIRIGDVFADTQVVDAKVVAGGPVAVAPLRRETA